MTRVSFGGQPLTSNAATAGLCLEKCAICSQFNRLTLNRLEFS